ncbi:MAG: fumarate hydratase [Treponema sp.]|jgi:fumarate hydratase class I|nr:fumarate hydratase [Treponema sp.]
MNYFQAIKKSFDKTSFSQLYGNADMEKPKFENGILYLPLSLLRCAAETAFRDAAFFLRETQLKLLAQRLEENSPGCNDRMVISMLLKNAISASKGEFCLCQDTGTAIIYAWKSESVRTGPGEREALEQGAAAAYKNNYLRSSIAGASSFFDEYNTGDNLPAQIHIESVPDDETSPDGPSYRLLFIAKGGGSSNRTKLFSMNKSLLEEKAFDAFLEEHIKALGTAACPPYRLALVAGGLSPEQNLEVQKLASSEILDTCPYFGDETESSALIRRDRQWEERVMEIGRKSGLGAQFGGTSLLLDARVLRMPRHAASCPVSIGVSCAAHRCILARIDRNGLFIENLVSDPASFLNEQKLSLGIAEIEAAPLRINLDQPIKETLNELSALKAGSLILLSGKLLVARDAAHLKWHKLITDGKNLPNYLFKYAVYYAGPAAAPPGRIIGSLGPTTAERMDPYAEKLMSRGASLITLAKGERSPAWETVCKKYGGAYLVTVGGAAALMAQDHVTGSELIDYPELGMEAVRLIIVRDMPALVMNV